MGKYDVPANIEYILAATGFDKLTYVGFSQGTSQMFAALTDPASTDYVNSKWRNSSLWRQSSISPT